MEYKKLKDLCYIDKGKTPISKAKEGEYPLIATAEEFRSSDSYDFDCKAVCVPLVSSTGHGHASLKRLHYYDGKFALGTILARLTSKDEKILLTNYLFIYLSFFKDELLVSMMKGSANVSLTVTAIKNLEIPIPKIEKQKMVVDLYNELVPLLDELKNEVIQQEEMTALFRDKILDMAVRGQLVKQDKNDESASKLLEKIRLEKEKLIKEKKIKKDKNESFIYRKDGSFYELIGKEEKCIDDEIPFEIPESWEWVRFNNINNQITCGYASTPKYVEDGVPFISAKNVKPYKFIPDNHKFISKDLYNKLTSTTNPERGDILLTRVGAGIGESAIIDCDMKFAIYVSLTLIKPKDEVVYNKYMLYWLNSPEGVSKARKNILGKNASQGNLNVQNVRKYIFPIPPLAEQKRIVEKIELLNTYFDKSLGEINNSKSQIENIMKCLLNEILIDDSVAKKQCEVLTKYIDLFNNTNEDANLTVDFEKDIAKFVDEYKVIDLKKYYDILENNGYDLEKTDIRDIDINKADISVVLSVIVCAYRNACRSDSNIIQVYSKDILIKWLSRLKELQK